MPIKISTPGGASLESPVFTGTPSAPSFVNASASAQLATVDDIVLAVNVKAYGATGNTVKNVAGDGHITSSSHTFTSASGTFTASDVGKYIQVAGAGTSGTKLVTTISGYTSATSVTLTAAAGTTVTTANYLYGTDDTTAVQSALNAAGAAPCGVCYIPPGNYLCGALTIPGGVTLEGSSGQAYYYQGSDFYYSNSAVLALFTLKYGSASPLFAPSDGGTYLAAGVRLQDFAIDVNGVGIASTGAAIHLATESSGVPRFWLMQRLNIFNCGTASGSAYAVYVGANQEACTMRDCTVLGTGALNTGLGLTAGDNGVGWYGSDATFDNNYVGCFGTYCFESLGGSADECIRVNGGGIFNGGYANVGTAGGGVTFVGTSIDGSAGMGIYAAEGPITLVGCRFVNNSGPNIYIAASGVQLTMHGCRAAGTSATYHLQTADHVGTYNDIGTIVLAGTTFGTAYCDYPGLVLSVGSDGASIGMGNTKIKDLANGSASSDAAAYGQVPTTVVNASGDTTGVTDTAAITAALGGQVILGPGTFWVNDLALTSYTTLRGQGKGLTVLKLPAAANGSVITNANTTSGNSYLALENLTIDGNYSAQTGGSPAVGALNLLGTGHVVIEHVQIQNAYGLGLFMNGLQLLTSRWVWLHDLEVLGCQGNAGIQISNGTRAVHYKEVTAHDNSTLYQAILLDHSEGEANGLYAYNNTSVGIYIRNVFDWVLNNLRANLNGQHGIYVVALTNAVGSDWQAFQNNASAGSYSDIYFDPTGYPTWGYGPTSNVVIDGIKAGELPNAGAVVWYPGGGSNPTNVPAYALNIGYGIGLTGTAPTSGTITGISASSGTLTITATNTFVAGQAVTFSSVASPYAGLNGNSYIVQTASSTQFTILAAITGTFSTSAGTASGEYSFGGYTVGNVRLRGVQLGAAGTASLNAPSALGQSGAPTSSTLTVQYADTSQLSGVNDLTFVVNTPTVSAGAVTVPSTSRINNVVVSATTAITMSTTNAVDGQLSEVRITDGGTGETLSWVNTENSTITAPTTSPGSATLPTSVLWQYNSLTSKWRCIGTA